MEVSRDANSSLILVFSKKDLTLNSCLISTTVRSKSATQNSSSSVPRTAHYSSDYYSLLACSSLWSLHFHGAMALEAKSVCPSEQDVLNLEAAVSFLDQ